MVYKKITGTSVLNCVIYNENNTVGDEKKAFKDGDIVKGVHVGVNNLLDYYKIPVSENKYVKIMLDYLTDPTPLEVMQYIKHGL
jgi:hypothetical protein